MSVKLLLNCIRMLLPSIMLFGCGQDQRQTPLPPRAIQWEEVSDEAATQKRVISGIVTSISETVLAFEVSGSVQSVEVNLGDIVQRDQVLARLDPEPLELRVTEAKAQLSKAQALLEEARASVIRYEEAGGAASRRDLERARALRNSHKSQVESAQARLELTHRDLRRSVLKAPFQGTISFRDVDPAMQVASGQSVFKMDNEEQGLRVEVQMPETLIAQVRQGTEVNVRFASGPSIQTEDTTVTAVVSEVGTRAVLGNAFPVRADLIDPPAGIRPGMTAEVIFEFSPFDDDNLEGFMVPIAAILAASSDKFAVFVYTPETSTVTQRTVEVGGVRGNRIAVLKGLAKGDIIATAGVSFLREGQQVTLLNREIMGITP